MIHRSRSVLAALLLSLCALAITWAQTSSQARFQVHVVQPGETLFRIALEYNMFAEQVALANRLGDMNNIRIGQRLIIPIVAAGIDQRLTHVVAPGETLASIAAAYSLGESDLMALNSPASAQALAAGTELVIVAGVETQAIAAVGRRDESHEPIQVAASVPSLPGQPFLSLDAPAAAFTHSVVAGDTLSEIALRYDLNLNALAQANNIADPSLLRVGQRLAIPGIQLPRLTQALPPVVESMKIDPPVLEAGRSARIELVTSESAKLSGSFLERDLRVISLDEGRRHLALLGVPMFTAKTVYPLSLTLAFGDGMSAAASANLQVVGGGYGYQTIIISNHELLAREVERAELDRLIQQTTDFSPQRYWSGTLSAPSAAAMNAFFGTLRSYNGSEFDRYHSGVDFAGAPGTPVLAAAGGIVSLVDRLQIRGNTTVIDHGWGLYTLYAHQSDITVQPGEIVSAGQVIGAIGSTGRSTGPHLHWETWLHGVNVDPLQWVNEVMA